MLNRNGRDERSAAIHAARLCGIRRQQFWTNLRSILSSSSTNNQRARINPQCSQHFVPVETRRPSSKLLRPCLNGTAPPFGGVCGPIKCTTSQVRCSFRLGFDKPNQQQATTPLPTANFARRRTLSFLFGTFESRSVHVG